MANPTAYTPSYDFSAFAEANPATPLPGDRVDIELAALELTTDELIAALANIRRSDGALANGIVNADSLSADLVIGFDVQGEWVTATTYAAGDGVTYGTSFYKCRVAHTSAGGTRPDLDSTTWMFLFTFDSIAVGDNAVSTAKIVDLAVTAAKLAADAVTTAKILDANVTAAKLATDAVTSAKILADAVTTVKILDANVTTAKIAAEAVTEAKIADSAVATAKIADTAVTFAKMAAAALTSIYSAARSYMLGLANTWTGQQSITTSALDLQVGQIKFPAAQNASADANTLDDYEEGTFTPGLSGSGSTLSFASQVGIYTKIGNRVHVDIRVELNTSGNTLGAGQLSITGLPFAAGASPSSRNFAFNWFAATSSYVGVWGALASGATALTMLGATAAATAFGTTANGTGATLLHATNGSRLAANFTYSI